MKVDVTYTTSDELFLARQYILYSQRKKTTRASEVNYEWCDKPGTLLSFFKLNKFAQGGWWEILENDQVVKSCGAYVFEKNLVIGVRYYAFLNESRHKYAFINMLIPLFIDKAKELKLDRLMMTFNDYNRNFPRVFSISKHSAGVNFKLKQILSSFQIEKNVFFNQTQQSVLFYDIK